MCYVTDILDDAKIYSSHANKKNIDKEDVKLAIQCRLDHSFTTPPPRDLLMEVAKHKNNTPLPIIKPYTGPKLPPDRYCLSSANYRLKSLKKAKATAQTSALVSSINQSLINPRITGPMTGTLVKPQMGMSSLGGASLSVVTKGLSQPTVTIRTSAPVTTSQRTALPIIRVTPGSVVGSSLSMKRKREDDDYDKV